MGHGMELECEESLLTERLDFYNTFASAHEIQVLKNAAFKEGIDLCCQICIRGHSAEKDLSPILCIVFIKSCSTPSN